jgi:arsenate reductase (glutaredoxin)
MMDHMSYPTHPINSIEAITVYGIPHCDTVKKARAWLLQEGLAHNFYNFKTQGVPPDQLVVWVRALGWEKLLNRQGTTWRKLDLGTQAAVHDAATAQALMRAQPSVIKRPVVQWSAGQVTVGFDPIAWLVHRPTRK